MKMDGAKVVALPINQKGSKRNLPCQVCAPFFFLLYKAMMMMITRREASQLTSQQEPHYCSFATFIILRINPIIFGGDGRASKCARKLPDTPNMARVEHVTRHVQEAVLCSGLRPRAGNSADTALKMPCQTCSGPTWHVFYLELLQGDLQVLFCKTPSQRLKELLEEMFRLKEVLEDMFC